MTFTQLKIFIAVAESGSVTRAAQELSITQSAASAAIATIENLYQVKLFKRVGRAIFLSEAGKQFLPEAQKALESTKIAVRSLRILSKETLGSVQIAASQTIANYWLPQRLAAFNDRYPGVKVNVLMSNTRAVENAILTGKADIGFVESELKADQLRIEEVGRDQPTLVISPKKLSLLGVNLNLNNMRSLPWVVREQGSGTRRILEDLVASKGLIWDELDIVLELPSNEAVREAVIAGAGITIISQNLVNQSIKSGLLKSVPLNVPQRSYSLVMQKNRLLSSAEAAFTEMLTENANDW